MSFVNNVIGAVRKVGTIIHPYLPKIAVVGGSAVVCGGAFLACKATLKIDQVLDEHRDQIEHIKSNAALLPDNEYNSKDLSRDKFLVYAATAGKIARLYAPAIGLGAAGFAAIFAGFGMIKNWHAAAVSTVTALDEKFASYRKNVIDEYGQEADKKFYSGKNSEPVEIEKVSVDEDGNETIQQVKAVTIDAVEDDFTKIYSPLTVPEEKWESHYLMTYRRLNDLELWYTKHLQSNRMDHLFMNTVLKELGLAETGVGHFYGWTNKPGQYIVRFSPEPYILIWDKDDDGQFPMMVPLPVYHDEDGNFHFINKEDEELWEHTNINDPNSVGYVLHFNVNMDANGIPREIYNDVYGPKNVN